MRTPVFLLSITMFFYSQLAAQDYSGLVEMKHHQATIFYSAGYEARAGSIARRVDSAMAYYAGLLNSQAKVTLLVLSVEDWPKYTNMPVIGMPHYKSNAELVVAAEDNAFWKSFIPQPDQLPAALAEKVKATYRDSTGQLSMQAFFDLLALHELAHAFHFQAGLNMQRKWMGELFVNMMLHTYIAGREPESLPALQVFPQMVAGRGTAGYVYTSLKDVHEKYEEIGSQHPVNYGWYQSRWHIAAGEIYDAEGVGASRRLWDALQQQKDTLDDAGLVIYLEQSGAKGVANMIRNW